jgi:hypothetical protein
LGVAECGEWQLVLTAGVSDCVGECCYGGVVTEITVWCNVRTTNDRLICHNLNYFEGGFHAELCNFSVLYTGVQWAMQAHVGWRVGNAADCMWDKRRLIFLFVNILIGRDGEVFQ